MPRQARLDVPGTLHHVIIRGIERRRIVDDQEDRDRFAARLGDLAIETGTAIYAWSLLTNHAHILLRSGSGGLPKFMRRFLTSYSVTYNLRHQRHGHLFQNRYKSIVCDEDTYFQELVRYIHLNPLRAKLVDDLAALERYCWCGHGVVTGKIKNDWQDREFVLHSFGGTVGTAIRNYRQFVEDGVAMGRRPDLVGGGLIRSLGGWSEVVSMRRHGDRQMSDGRILGDGDFVQRILEESGERQKHHFSAHDRRRKIQELIVKTCEEENINPRELQSGSRRRPVSRVRTRLARQLVYDHGVPPASAARALGVSTSAVSKITRSTER
ncbi:transposase [Desulfoferrobacter suflitae]|uniref:transposase n=1 Tax=Desulfoferrobacter suflitae TaxID=2865782 RepID=UPI002164E687|nr:transposase [Desulfoferrobacter suflitae]MCK8602611.1 transposase [Desulfoferrobacter suflitae]